MAGVEPLDNPVKMEEEEEEDILTDIEDEKTVIISLTTGEEATDDKNDIAPLLDVRDDEPPQPHRSIIDHHRPSSSKAQPPRKKAKVNRRRNTGKVKTEANQSSSKPDDEEEVPEEDDETLDMAETYADYVPQKWKHGQPHPDTIVETASLSGVISPDISHTLSIPKAVINQGLLSAPQLEAIVYACQQHEFFLSGGERAGYLIGDGAGVGKGRTVAGIIYENWLNGRKKALWISVSADLKEDSIRDLGDIGAGKIEVKALSSFKYEKIKPDKFKNGVLFMTYSGLIGKTTKRGKFSTRLSQITDWLGKEFDGVIVFDECHRAKNLCPTKTTKPTKTGVAVSQIQLDLPKARIVYASATGASEPKNMAYMTRLGIWGKGTPFKEFRDFINSIEKRGIKVMELVAMDMKLRGAYIARQLSFKGVTFRIEDVPLTAEFVDMYNQSVDLWVDAMGKFIDAIDLLQLDGKATRVIWSQFWGSHQRFFKYLCIAGKVSRAIDIAKEAVIDGKCVVIGLQSTGEARTADQFENEEEPEDFISTAKGVFQNLVEKQFPHVKVNTTPPATRKNSQAKTVKRERLDDSDSDAGSSYNAKVFFNTSAEVSGNDSDSSSVSTDTGSYNVGGRKRKLGNKVPRNTGANSPLNMPFMPSEASLQQVAQDRKELLEKIEALGNLLPKNSLDQLINELGGPGEVAELTGRKMRLVQMEDGKIDYQSRIEVGVTMSQINLTEKRRFMDGEKLIAIISEAASNGISLQSDRRAKNTRPRVHITIELPWSADRAIQQFGRTHRSNQANSPEYVFLISDVAGERRFASIVAKRLESLGALTHGDRRATKTRDLSRFNVDSIYGRKALQEVMTSVRSASTLGLAANPPSYVGDFIEDVTKGLVGVGLLPDEAGRFASSTQGIGAPNISRFLNRILGMHIVLQNALFTFFTSILAALISDAKKNGRFDMGLLNLGNSESDKTEILSTETFTRKHSTGLGTISLHKVSDDRGISWEEIHRRTHNMRGSEDGFYLTRHDDPRKRRAVFVQGDEFPVHTSDGDKIQYYTVYKPHLGLDLRRDTLHEIKSKYSKITPDQAIQIWESQYRESAIYCSHAYWSYSKQCKNKLIGLECEYGMRKRTYHVLSGSVLLCWNAVEAVLGRSDDKKPKIQIVRVQISDGMKFVGVLIPTECVESLRAKLSGAQNGNPNSWEDNSLPFAEVYDADNDSDSE